MSAEIRSHCVAEQRRYICVCVCVDVVLLYEEVSMRQNRRPGFSCSLCVGVIVCEALVLSHRHITVRANTATAVIWGLKWLT